MKDEVKKMFTDFIPTITWCPRVMVPLYKGHLRLLGTYLNAGRAAGISLLLADPSLAPLLRFALGGREVNPAGQQTKMEEKGTRRTPRQS